MLNYTKMIYKTIGNRIQTFRLNLKEIERKQVDFCASIYYNSEDGEKYPIDQPALSKIEKGIIIKNKNPYLMSLKQIITISERMKILPDELIWGTTEEKKNLAKLLIVAIITNDAKTKPFISFDNRMSFFKWAEKQKCLDFELHLYLRAAIQALEEIVSADGATKVAPASKDYPPTSIDVIYNKIYAYFKEQYGFFFDETNTSLYELIHDDNLDDNLLVISNKLLEQLLSDLEFTLSYAERLNIIISNPNEGNPLEVAKKIDEILHYKGIYPDIALDYGEEYYYLFVRAFNNFWNQYGDKIISFFDKTIFCYSELVNSGLKHFQNHDIENTLNSSELSNIISNPNLISQYTDSNIILAKNYITLTFQLIIYKQFYISEPSDNEYEIIWEYLSDNHLRTKKCITTVLQK